MGEYIVIIFPGLYDVLFFRGKGGDCLRFSERKVLCTVEDNLIYRLYIKKFQKKSFGPSNMGRAKKN